jgi:D-alanyl-D-alanine carboxypeptidase
MVREKVEHIVRSSVDGKHVTGAVLAIQHQGESELFASGDFRTDEPYFIASTTKLYTTAVIFHLCSKELLRFDDHLNTWFDSSFLKDLHVYKGVEYTDKITIRHLLTHTSGLPDYFQHKQKNGMSLLMDLQSGKDASWSFEDVVMMAKEMKAAFIPGTPGKALYSDTNYQLLGRIAEQIAGKSIEELYEEIIFRTLSLKSTYMYSGSGNVRDVRFKDRTLHIPRAMSSFRADGGLVSTASESLTFLKAFFDGTFFPQHYLQETVEWNRVMYPIEYGLGYMRFQLPLLFSLFRRVPPIYGHSGLSGAFEFYCPDKDLYMAGTVNQLHSPGRSFRVMMKVLMSVI